MGIPFPTPSSRGSKETEKGHEGPLASLLRGSSGHWLQSAGLILDQLGGLGLGGFAKPLDVGSGPT